MINCRKVQELLSDFIDEDLREAPGTEDRAVDVLDEGFATGLQKGLAGQPRAGEARRDDRHC